MKQQVCSTPDPGPQLLISLLKRQYLAGFLLRHPNRIQPFEQHLALFGWHVEGQFPAIRQAHRAGPEIDGQDQGAGVCGLADLLNVFGCERDRENTVAKAVVVEDGAERRCNHAAQAELANRPRLFHTGRRRAPLAHARHSRQLLQA